MSDANPQDSGPLSRRSLPNASTTNSVSPDETRPTGIHNASSFGRGPGSDKGQFGREGDPAIQSLPIGTYLGRYQIQQVLGCGNMGIVYLGHDAQLNRLVALKVARLDGKGSVLAERLMREARAVATLSHPNICPIFEIGVHDGMHFIAMGFVNGRPLSEYIRSGKPLPERDAAKVVRKIALALHEAHEHGILHRDLKPANIMIDKRAEPIVMDFGLACCFEDDTQARLTHEGTVVGTPSYMSPEQIEGKQKLGPKTDIYSLGVVLYELLAGRCPFEGSVVSVINQVLNQEPSPITELRPEISPAAVQICTKAMAKNPEDRFDSMREFAKVLSTFLSGAPPRIPEPFVSDSPSMSSDGMIAVEPQYALNAKTRELEQSTAAATESPVHGRRLLIALSSAVVLLLAVIALLLAGVLMNNRSKGPITTQADSSDNTNFAKALQGERFQSSDQSENQLPVDDRPPREGKFEPRPGPGKGRPGPHPHGPPPGSDSREPIHPKRLESLPVDEQFDLADRNQDEFLDASELPLHLIHRADANDDDELTIDEFKSAVEKLGREFYGPPSDEERRDLPDHHGPPRGPGP